MGTEPVFKAGDAPTVCGKSECQLCVPPPSRLQAPAPDAPIPTLDLIANAKQLQTLEADLYANMSDINRANPQGVDVQAELLARISGVNNTKQQLFKLIEERYQDANDNLAHDKLALDAERRILEIAEQQLAQARENVENERDYHTTQERIAEIDEYAFDSSSAQNKLLRILFIGLTVLAVELFIMTVLPGVLARRNPGNAWKPSEMFNNIMTGTIMLTVIITGVYAFKHIYDMSGRSDRIYSQYTFGGVYDHPSGNGAPGETVWEHDERFFSKVEAEGERGLKSVDSSVENAASTAKQSIQSAAGSAMSSVGTKAKRGKKKQAVGGHLPQSAVADPAASSGAPVVTHQSGIPGAHPVGDHSSMVETFAAF